MDFDLRTALRWIMYGVVAIIALSLIGVLVDVASSILWLLLKAGIVVFIILFIVEMLDGLWGGD